MFPNPSEPGQGPFVRYRLQRIAAAAEVRVVAPVPVIDYSRKGSRWIGSRAIPRRRADGALSIEHPRWLYPPLGGASNGLWMYLQLLPFLRRLQREFPFQLIDAHFGHPDGVAASMLASSLGVPFIVTLRGNETKHAAHPLRGRMIARALRRAARVIGVSESLRRFAISLGVPEERAITIPNGIDAGVFYPRDRSECRARYGIPPDVRVVLSAGFLIERKGHHRTIRALKDTSALLLIAGGPGREGRYEEQIRAAVRETGMNDRVRFLGHVPNEKMPDLMSAADLLCLATTREGWPNVVHEAMACGTPVVATAVGGVEDMIPGQDYGYVVPPGDQEALRTALARALEREWDRAAISTHARARSWDQVAREALEVMKAVIEENS